jgi:cation transport ATPase
VLDKTGTVTTGRMTLQGVVTAAGTDGSGGYAFLGQAAMFAQAFEQIFPSIADYVFQYH